MNRRNFLRNLAGIGLFSILPGAGRVWKAQRPDFRMVPAREWVLNLPPGTPTVQDFFNYRIRTIAEQYHGDLGIWGAACLDRDGKLPELKTIVLPIHFSRT